jgi:hypothetical protein
MKAIAALTMVFLPGTYISVNHLFIPFLSALLILSAGFLRRSSARFFNSIEIAITKTHLLVILGSNRAYHGRGCYCIFCICGGCGEKAP